jgi:hypothetical protein
MKSETRVKKSSGPKRKNQARSELVLKSVKLTRHPSFANKPGRSRGKKVKSLFFLSGAVWEMRADPRWSMMVG